MITSNLTIYDGIEVRAQSALDPRTIVTTREQLTDINTWPHDVVVDEEGNEHYTVYMKEGMQVTVTGPKENRVFETYMLIDVELITSMEGWMFMGQGGSGGGGGMTSGNIDGGRADENYTPGQVINGGDASSRGDIID